jgi:hypothetical protein
MKDEKQALFYVAGKQKNCEFSLKFILQKQDGLWRNFFTTLKLVKEGTKQKAEYDYGEFMLAEKLLPVGEGLNIISSLYPKNGEKGKLSIPNLCEFNVERPQPASFVSSGQGYDVVKNPWPSRYFECKVQQDQICQDWGRELLNEALPYYPDLNEAVLDFFSLPSENFNSYYYGSILVIVLDYRARVESLKQSFSKVDLKLHAPEIEYTDLLVKVFAKAKERTVVLPDLYPKSDLVSFDLGFQPDRLHTVLVSKRDKMRIDAKEFAPWGRKDESIIVERPEEEILLLLKTGESQNLEYKPDVVDESKKNDLVETVVAFLNTNRGLIVVGVNDDGSITGVHKDVEDLQKLIHDSCDPPPRNIRMEEKTIEGHEIIIVEVPEGDDKPYQSKRDKNWYVRHNANDMRMERSELMRFVEERGKSALQRGLIG